MQPNQPTIPSNANPINLGIAVFKPYYTPRQMLMLGVYGGTAFSMLKTREGLSEDLLSVKFTNTNGRSAWGSMVDIPDANYFPGADTRSVRKGSMDIPPGFRMIDPAGWFQWYSQFYYGRKIEAYDPMRVNQWGSQLNVCQFYITKYLEVDINPLQALTYLQSMVNYGWDPTINFLTKEPQNAPILDYIAEAGT